MNKTEVYRIESDDPSEMRDDLINNFPEFRDKCLASGAAFQIGFSSIAGARFERDWGLTVREFVFTNFFHTDLSDQPVKKYERRKLKIS